MLKKSLMYFGPIFLMHLNNRIRDCCFFRHSKVSNLLTGLRVLGKAMVSRALSMSLIYNDWRLQFYWPRLSPPLTGGDYSILDVVK